MVKPVKILKVELKHGDYMGVSEGCFEVRRKNGETERYPFFEKPIGEVVLFNRYYVSTETLSALSL